MKICLVGYGNEDGTRSWTDVTLKLQEIFEKKNSQTVYIRWRGKITHKYIDKFKRLIGRVIYLPNSLRDPGMYRVNARLFRKLLSNIDSDVFLFMGEQCLDNRIKDNTRCYAYVDSVLQPIIRENKIDLMGQDLFFFFYEKNDKNSFNHCDKIFTQNEWSRKYLIENYNISADKVINVGFGINTDYFYGNKNYKKHRILIVLRKGLEKIKGLDLLLQAFDIAKKSIPDLILDVVGTELESREGVNYYYNKPREVTLELFRQDSIYVMPALCESNGITYLEALANKMPIIGLERFAFPEFSGNGEYGFILKQGNPEVLAACIVNAFKDEELLKSMGERGQEFVKLKYDWNIVAEKMLHYMIDDMEVDVHKS